jgi:hypothetical protein
VSIEHVKEDLNLAKSREEADAIFKSAYAAGFTLQELGDIVGHTREYIRQRVARPVDVELLREYPPHERVVRKQYARKAEAVRRKRILGLPLTAPALNVPAETLNELARLRVLTETVRGWTPIDSPARQALKPFGDLLFQTIQDYGIPQQQLERLMGLKGSTLTVWLKSHGYLKQSPSQKSYRGIGLNGPKKGRKGLVSGDSCRRGHVLTESNIGTQKAGQYCKDCTRESAKLRYQKAGSSVARENAARRLSA